MRPSSWTIRHKQHIPVAAWARAQILLGVQHSAAKDLSRAQLEKVRRDQEERLAETRVLLRQTRRLYQSAIVDRAKEPDGQTVVDDDGEEDC